MKAENGTKKETPFIVTLLQTVVICLLVSVSVGWGLKFGFSLVKDGRVRKEVPLKSITVSEERLATTEGGAPLRIFATITNNSNQTVMMVKVAFRLIDEKGSLLDLIEERAEGLGELSPGASSTVAFGSRYSGQKVTEELANIRGKVSQIKAEVLNVY